ncbi:hypothetical protein U9M48_017441, partial [Paspalum notatum var. saurae]
MLGWRGVRGGDRCGVNSRRGWDGWPVRPAGRRATRVDGPAMGHGTWMGACQVESPARDEFGKSAVDFRAAPSFGISVCIEYLRHNHRADFCDKINPENCTMPTMAYGK